jgi:hypothetical protein
MSACHRSATRSPRPTGRPRSRNETSRRDPPRSAVTISRHAARTTWTAQALQSKPAPAGTGASQARYNRQISNISVLNLSLSRFKMEIKEYANA